MQKKRPGYWFYRHDMPGTGFAIGILRQQTNPEMNQPNARPAITGEAMDKVIPGKRKQRWLRACFALMLLGSLAGLAWYMMPQGLMVQATELRIASVEQGLYLDDLMLRATAEPLNSVVLDTVESGRVEEVFAQDGSMVGQGQLLFRLSNPQRNLELLARQAEHTQQISNLANLRVNFQLGNTDHQRRLSALEFELAQTKKQHARNEKLAEKNFISLVALEESADKLERAQFAVAEEKTSRDAELKVKRDAQLQMENGIRGLQSGLQLVNATVAALAVRAPVAGRLTDFHLQVGETMTTGKRIGRIDDPRLVKLVAQIDEYYLSRISSGRNGIVHLGDRTLAVVVRNVFPQIKDGRFKVELEFVQQQDDAISPGQSLEANITLGEPGPAMLLPNASFITDTGGNWVFVLKPDGTQALRREIKIGRRNNRQIEVLSGLAKGDKVIVSSYANYLNVKRLQINK
ncbi:efflux RND transporter periplasmic adaptor subunit [Undibacterium pigrum]|nr:efflux RND transporter periplasmic adaptor subunit [Undibacterium pigrum]